MFLSQVNRARLLCALALAAACAPAGSNSRGGETTSVAAAGGSPAAGATPAGAAAQDSNITLADVARTEGSATAPLWVIMVSDFQCPYCKQWHDTTFPALRDEYVKTGKVRVAYINYPLANHAQAWPSAEAAMCAAAQGKFWPMHDAIFDSQERWSSGAAAAATFDSLARASGVDIQRWRQCVASGAMKPLVRADHQRASAAGIHSTPSFLIGNELLTGAHPIASFRRIIDAALSGRKPGS